MKKILFLTLLIITSKTVLAQPYKTVNKYKPYNWMIGVSWSAIEDDGNQLGNLFSIGSSWHIQYFPSKLSVDKYLRYGWSVEASATYNKYASNKVVNDTTGLSSIFLCADVNAKWSMYNLYAPRARWIEPYFTFGLGYTHRSNAAVAQHVPTLNLGLGFNLWFHQSVGLQFHTNGKLGLWPGFWDSGKHTNYLQHSAGLMFRIGGSNTKHRNGAFGSKRHKWTRKNKRYKKKGGH